MTVEELNIKISADAGEFSRGLAEAETSLEKFRSDAVKAGEEVTKAFDGLVNVGVNTVYNGENAHNSTVQPAETSPDKPSVSPRLPRMQRATSALLPRYHFRSWIGEAAER